MGAATLDMECDLLMAEHDLLIAQGNRQSFGTRIALNIGARDSNESARAYWDRKAKEAIARIAAIKGAIEASR